MAIFLSHGQVAPNYKDIKWLTAIGYQAFQRWNAVIYEP
ncbi:hypothetical protein VCR4J2_580276 [Vibrio coralliirubri]|nr:hypothetical protein VCR4J2_580276 [Vibrio coralliirubri]